MKSGKGKPPSLKRIYYRTFVSLVVIPLLMVFIGTMFVINHQIRKASLENISTFQEGLADTLKQEIDENSLQMAHFVYSQDGYFLQLAESVASTEGSVQYKYNNELADGFQMAMVSSQNIVGGTFYMKNGAQVHMKETVLLSTSSVRGTRWYQQAMERKNVVAVGAYDTSNMRFTANTQKNRQLILVSALSPDATLDKSGQVEMTAFFTVSKAGNSMRQKGRSNALGTTVLLDDEGTLLFSGNETVSEYFRQHGSEFVEGTVEYRAAPDGEHPAKYLFQTRLIPGCGWKLVTVVRSSFLTQGLDRCIAGIGDLRTAGIVFPVFAVLPKQHCKPGTRSGRGNGEAGQQRSQCAGAADGSAGNPEPDRIFQPDGAEFKKYAGCQCGSTAAETPCGDPGSAKSDQSAFYCQHVELHPLYGAGGRICRHPEDGRIPDQDRIVFFPQQH